MIEIKVHIADNINEMTCASAIQRLCAVFKQYGVNCTMGQGGEIDDWKNELSTISYPAAVR